MSREHRYVLGKLDANDGTVGKLVCEAAITWELTDGQFSMCAEIWNPRHTDVTTCGQCVDYVASKFPSDMKARRMVEVWNRYHLNHMKAGSEIQEEWLLQNPIPEEECRYPKSHYEIASSKLAEAGLNPDPDGYIYGHECKMEEIPADIIAEIESWGK